MPFCSGDKLGPYEILAPLGTGGMGDVYERSETRLGREVVIKADAGSAKVAARPALTTFKRKRPHA